MKIGLSQKLNPSSVFPPFSAYSHAVDCRGPFRWLHISGQVGVDLEGRVASDSEEQHRQTWKNLLAILQSAEMKPQHLVKVTAYITEQADTPIYRRVRDESIPGVECASTLLVISGLAHPDYKVEIEAIAAEPVDSGDNSE